ncbi:unnamed protein product [Pieris macdunnoughi]|uniref:Uncharacterized protein n=1 Tax=Pieris macdunnoughi TaxID=345717 RepID=A0A821TWE4_9NEOP|nr:unnamed protein product [Pieris macdunnoughi]
MRLWRLVATLEAGGELGARSGPSAPPLPPRGPPSSAPANILTFIINKPLPDIIQPGRLLKSLVYKKGMHQS